MQAVLKCTLCMQRGYHAPNQHIQCLCNACAYIRCRQNIQIILLTLKDSSLASIWLCKSRMRASASCRVFSIR